jgi:hypothetical protein
MSKFKIAAAVPSPPPQTQIAEDEQGGTIPAPSAGGSFGSGDSVTVFTPDPGAQLVHYKAGSASAPDGTYAPVIRVSRTLSVPEEAFQGDGAPGLASIYGVTRAVAASQGQAVGVYGGAITDGTYVGTNSLPDAIGGYFVGRSSAASTRTGMGLFASGRREGSGVATGAQIVVDNETVTAGVYSLATASNVKGIFLSPIGTANAAVGLEIGKLGTAQFLYAVAVKEGACTEAAFRDDSSAKRSILIKGSHEKGAIAVTQGAGIVVLGAEEPSTTGHLFELFNSGTLDPIAKVGSGAAGANTSVEWHNAAGSMKIFMAGGTNTFLIGAVNGDCGLNFTPGKTLHIGPQTKTSLFRVSELGVAVNGNTPIAKASAIASPAAELAPLKTAVDAIREAIKNFGITA